MIPKPRFAVTLAALVAYAAILHWTFQVKIAPVFAYLGARYREPDPLNYLLALLALVVVALLLPPRLEQPSDGVVWVLFVTLIVPATLVPQYALILDAGSALALGVSVSVVSAVLAVLSRLGPFSGSVRVHAPPAVVWCALAAVSLITYAWVSATFGLAVVNFSLDQVRDIRFGYRDQIATGSPLLAYLIRYQGSVINPLLMATGVLRRRPLIATAGALGQLVLYSATGYKLFYLSIPAIIGLTWLLKHRRDLAGQAVLLGVLAASALAIVADRLRGGPILWVEIFIDRMLIVPGMLSAAYVQVFADRPKYQFDSILPFVDSGYSLPPGFFVGAAFSGNAEANANAGFIGDGYAQLGYLGLVIEAAAVLLILWGVNATGRHLPTAVTLPVLLLPALSLANVSPFTTLLTGGFGFAMLLMATLPSDGWGSTPSVRTDEGRARRAPSSRIPSRSRRSIEQTPRPRL